MISQANLLASIFAFALGVALLTRSPRSHLFQNFAILCASISSIFLFLLLYDWNHDPIWDRLRYVSLAIFIPALLRFFRSFPEEIKPKDFLISPPWLAASLTLLMMAALPRNDWSPLLAHLLVFLAMLRALMLLFKQYRAASNPLRKARLKLLLVGSVVTFIAILLEQIPAVPPLGTFSTAIFLYFVSQALLHYRLLDLKEILGRGIVFSIQALILASVFPLVAGSRQENEPIQFFLFNALLAASVIAILFEPLRRLSEKITRRFLSRRRFEFEKTIQEIRDTLPSKISEAEAIQFVLEEMQRSGRTTHVSVYEFDPGLEALRLRGFLGEELHLPQVIVNPRLNQYLLLHPKPLILESLERQMVDLRQKEPFAMLIGFLNSLHAQVVLPMIHSSGKLTGIVNLRDRGFEEAYSTSEIRLLMTLAGQLATVLRNLRLYNQLLENDRLVALGEMAAGLAHEIRNPLGAIKGAAQVLKQKTNGSGDQFLGIIVEETDRLNRVLEQFLDFARAEKPALSRAPLKPLLEHTVALLSANGLPQNLNIVLAIDADLPELPLDAERMKQVFINLAKNAVEALPNGGTVVISAAKLESGEVEIRFSDSGRGIQEKDPARIFAPFYTTKDKGSGLGLAICQRIVLDHGGEIEAVPQGEHGGASIRIRLQPTPKGDAA